MKRIFALTLLCLFILSGCSSGPDPALSEMLGTMEGSAYGSPLGFMIDAADMQIFTKEDLAAMNQVDEFTPDALASRTDSGNAVTVFAAAPSSGASVSVSLFPAAGLSEDVRSASDYADYGLTLIFEKLESAGYTGIQAEKVSVKVAGGEHPAILCSARITEGVPYHLLQICFQEGDWVGTLSLSSVESEDALGALLSRITAND